MIVGDAEMEFGARGDREKTKWMNVSVGGESGVELALDFLANDGQGVAGAGDQAHIDRLSSITPCVAPPAPVKIEAGEAELREIERGHAVEARCVQRRAHLHDVNRAVGIQVAPAQHRRLEQIEPHIHLVRVLRALRCPNIALRFDAPVLLDAEPDVRGVNDVVDIDVHHGDRRRIAG